ncbi:hypothetical protein AB0D54_38510 [Streptomyces xanthophaeus]|uniref:hypothetical protein n=1 Tax=Streptomyces xanthophaeus TaxID=67385 RepID=UPI0034318B09
MADNPDAGHQMIDEVLYLNGPKPDVTQLEPGFYPDRWNSSVFHRVFVPEGEENNERFTYTCPVSAPVYDPKLMTCVEEFQTVTQHPAHDWSLGEHDKQHRAEAGLPPAPSHDQYPARGEGECTYAYPPKG